MKAETMSSLQRTPSWAPRTNMRRPAKTWQSEALVKLLLSSWAAHRAIVALAFGKLQLEASPLHCQHSFVKLGASHRLHLQSALRFVQGLQLCCEVC